MFSHAYVSLSFLQLVTICYIIIGTAGKSNKNATNITNEKTRKIKLRNKNKQNQAQTMVLVYRMLPSSLIFLL